MTSAIIRRWEASAPRSKIGNWVETFKARAFPHMAGVEGFLGVTFLAERSGDPCRVTVLTKWEDESALRRYAGEDYAKTVMPDFMAPFFTEYDAEATFHDEVFSEAKQ